MPGRTPTRRRKAAGAWAITVARKPGMGSEPDSLAAWLEEHPPAPDRFKASLAGIPGRVGGVEELLLAVRELLDELALAPRGEVVARAIAEEPPRTGEVRLDAYLGALAEHLAVSWDKG